MEYDDDVAKREGWAIFACDDGRLAIQRLDTPQAAFEDMPLEPIFASDEAAVWFVTKRANEGSEMHKAALAKHGTVYSSYVAETQIM